MENSYKYMEDDNFSVDELIKRANKVPIDFKNMTKEEIRQWFKDITGFYPEEVKHSD